MFPDTYFLECGGPQKLLCGYAHRHRLAELVVVIGFAEASRVLNPRADRAEIDLADRSIAVAGVRGETDALGDRDASRVARGLGISTAKGAG